jgi:hypothetical protein
MSTSRLLMLAVYPKARLRIYDQRGETARSQPRMHLAATPRRSNLLSRPAPHRRLHPRTTNAKRSTRVRQSSSPPRARTSRFQCRISRHALALIRVPSCWRGCTDLDAPRLDENHRAREIQIPLEALAVVRSSRHRGVSRPQFASPASERADARRLPRASVCRVRVFARLTAPQLSRSMAYRERRCQ